MDLPDLPFAPIGTLEERLRRREIEANRDWLLRDAGVDPRLLDFVWHTPSVLADALVTADLTDVGWLDLATMEDGPAYGLIPLCNLDTFEHGIALREDELVHFAHIVEHPIEVFDAWTLIFGGGLAALAANLAAGTPEPATLFEGPSLKRHALLDELARLGGPELVHWAAAELGISPR